ncbi:MAG TPA: YciI family protein [Acidimicrobiales bacterium]|nr:YciI family protein [Acidimicrobiales bacterium]
MQGFVFRLVPPRPTFTSDMTDEERSAMGEHAAYWRDLMARGSVLAFGPVADPAGPYGLGVVLADDMAGAEALRDGDPAVRKIGMKTEIAPMIQLVTPGGEYS